MDQIKQLLAKLNLRQRILIVAVAVLVAAGLVTFTHWTKERDFHPLYTNLGAEDAAAVVQKLRESGTEFRLAENGSTVLVPSSRASELRLQFAAAGLPKTGRAGFEIFDKTNFGMTDFAEHINYRRALEGELERSIMGLAEVERARVHVTFPKESVFVESREPAKASVMVKLKMGLKLAPQNIKAICHLVASAVEGLDADAVSVLDMNGNLLNRPRKPDDGTQPSEAALEYKQQVEKDLLAKINTTLEALMGPEKFRSGISVDCDFSNGDQTDESFDPSKSVMTNSQKTEEVSGANSASGVPGTPSALPRPAARPGTAGYSTTRRTETLAYQTSRTVRHLRLPQGNIKRISASVLVDQDLRWEGAGPKAKRILDPPSPEKLKTIHDLVAATIGFDTNRGDQLIVETLPFETTLSIEPPPAPVVPVPPAPFKMPEWMGKMLGQKNIAVIAGAAGGALVLLVAAITFFLMRRRKKKKLVQMTAALAAGTGAAGAIPGGTVVDQAEKELQDRIAEQQAKRQQLEAEALKSIKVPEPATKKSEVLTKHIGEAVKKDPLGAAQILRTWLEDTDH